MYNLVLEGFVVDSYCDDGCVLVDWRIRCANRKKAKHYAGISVHSTLHDWIYGVVLHEVLLKISEKIIIRSIYYI